MAILFRAGGSKAYGDWAISHIKTKSGALFATFVLAIVLGVDDYFNNLTTGKVRLEQKSGDDADEQGRIDFLGDERENDGNHRGYQGPDGAVELTAIVLGVDDYFNNLTTGNVMRPVTDGHKISRAKLAYMCDATAAPVCILWYRGRP